MLVETGDGTALKAWEKEKGIFYSCSLLSPLSPLFFLHFTLTTWVSFFNSFHSTSFLSANASLSFFIPCNHLSLCLYLPCFCSMHEKWKLYLTNNKRSFYLPYKLCVWWNKRKNLMHRLAVTGGTKNIIAILLSKLPPLHILEKVAGEWRLATGWKMDNQEKWYARI